MNLNRRSFLQTLGGIVFSTIAFGTATLSRRTFASDAELADSEAKDSDVKDLVVWAPFQAFLPEETDPQPSDPSNGTKTGVLTAAAILKGEAVTMRYWHGHGGVTHTFTVTADHMKQLQSGNPVVITIPTTVVDDHYHVAIIDPSRPA